MKKLVTLYLFVVLLLSQFWFGESLLATIKPYLCGSIVLGSTDKIGQRVDLNELATWPEWTNSNIIGFRTRTFWNVVQPSASPAAFDWSYLDKVHDLCLLHNKKWELSIVAGEGTPDWVYQIHGGTAVQVLTHDATGAEVLMPVPWDIGYQTPYFAFINAVAAKYESDPRMLIVMQGGFMSGNSGMYFCTEADTTSNAMVESFAAASPAVSTFDTAYIQGAEQVITQSMAAFPTTQQSVTFVNPVPGHAVNLGSTLKDWWTSPSRSWYPRMGFFVSSLFAATTPYASPAKTLYTHGFQCWHPIAGYTPQGDLYDGNPTPNPLPPYPGSLADTILNGVQKGGQYVEFYRPDTTAAPAQNVFALIANTQLCDNAPASPTPTPTNTPTPTPCPTATPTSTPTPTPTPTDTPIAIGRRQANCADAVTITISPTHQRGILLVQAYNGLNTTIPTLPTGWTNLNSISGAGTSVRWGWKASVQGETDCGIWTNATQVCCHEYSNTNTVAGPLNFHKASSLGGILSYTGFTLTHTDGTSWVVGFGGDSAATGGMDANTAGGRLTNVANVLTANGLDTNGPVSVYTTDTLTAVGGGAWVTGTMELAQATPTSTPTATATATFTPTPTATFTPTPTATSTPTSTATATFTPTPTVTATPTASPTSTFTPTPTATFTPSSTSTSTPTVTATFTPTPTPSATSTPTPTPTPICFLVAPTILSFTDAQCHLGVLSWKNNDPTTVGFLVEGSDRPDRFRTIAVTNATPRYVLSQSGNTRYYRVRGFNFNNFFHICYSGYTNILELTEQDVCPPTPTPTATATP